jgi:transposase
MTYDQRIGSFPTPDRVSLLTLDRRVVVPFRFGGYAEGMLQRTRGHCDLRYRTHTTTFVLAITVDVSEPTPDEAGDVLGVDLGVITLAATSDGERLNPSTGPKHAHIQQVRARDSRFRQQLQKKGSQSAKRLLRKRSGREQRFARDLNHCISTALAALVARVSTAQGTWRAVALEDRTHIRDRAGQTVAKRQRRVLQRWACCQLCAVSAYTPALAGVPVVLVHPASTSQTCSRCGHREKANRQSQATCLCVACGYSAHADLTAAVNMRERAHRRAAVIPPDAAALAG